MRSLRGDDRGGGRSGAIFVLMVLATPGVAWAKDRPPLPFPLACPIDAPVRVASDSTLSRYTALDDCPLDRVIAASYEGPAPVRRPVEITPAADMSPRMVRAERRKKGRIGDTSVESAILAGSGTRVVRIIPVLPDPLPEPAPLVVQPSIVTAGLSGPVGDYAPVAATGGDVMVLGLRPATATTFDGMIANAAVRHRVDPLMLHSVIRQESGYRPQAVSHAGARGLMQIMPATGVGLGVTNSAYLMDPATNIDAGARLLRRLWDKFGGRFELVLAAYNAGEGAVRRFGMTVPPFAETRNYVARVQSIYHGLAVGAGAMAAR
ncbi:lytic transglycosylase domain-containing protein [uncultured Sphingomonas sp.]|uniref:lytic transglycosylase domain-containing protein n=1 Tax=uncultured Sphingomonas sp. TaxID=158754 RepID=UPI0035CB2310